ncbi:MAG: thiamine-phosphate kinase [Dehalococcoidia bacterium]|nr:thiamine-phosphate kinase [Dehalococcoidia bacterium]
MKLITLGEFGLIGLIKDAVLSTRHMSSATSGRILIDIGDDAAAWTGSSKVQLATTDSLIEDVHFRFAWCSWEDLGYKSLAVNLSDIAAMGGVPRFALVSLSCPPDIDSDAVMQYYAGMTHLAAEHGTVIIGGNLTSSPLVTSTVCLFGEAEQTDLLTRSAARPGDAIAVTGSLGGAAAALALLSGETDLTRVPVGLTRTLTHPHPRVTESRMLVQEGVHCAIDISDGLLSDLGHICECSNVSATIRADSLPLCPDYTGPADSHIGFALNGGEDYELLFTCDAATVSRVANRLDCPVTVVGEVTASTGAASVVVLDSNGMPLPMRRVGWSHFA